MENKGLLFIPDISGFTRFVTQTEIDHSSRIIEELLGVVIDANEIGLDVSEVEGDAVLFFRFGDRPDPERVCQQVARMFREFHQWLSAYEIRRFCQCRACVAASDLTLKVITHYGEFTNYKVRQFDKLIGKDVIVAHQLLKNDIDHHEYWLVTSDFLRDPVPDRFPPWVMWNAGAKRTENGDIAFRYTPLSELRRDLEPAPLLDLGLSDGAKMLSASREYDAHIITLFHAMAFGYRSRWQDGVVRIEELDHFLPRVGMRCRRVTEDGEVTMFASSIAFRPERIEFSETDEQRTFSSLYTLEQLDEGHVRLTIDFYLQKGFLRERLWRWTKRRKAEASLHRSLANLEPFLAELDVPTEY